MVNFFNNLDKSRKIVLPICFVLQILFIFIEPADKASSLFQSCFYTGIRLSDTYPISFRFRFIIAFCLIWISLILSLISVICSLMNRSFLFSISLGVLFLSVIFAVYIRDITGIDYIDETRTGLIKTFLYRFLISFSAFVICLTLELLSKYRDRLIKKAQSGEPSEDNSKSVD